MARPELNPSPEGKSQEDPSALIGLGFSDLDDDWWAVKSENPQFLQARHHHSALRISRVCHI